MGSNITVTTARKITYDNSESAGWGWSTDRLPEPCLFMWTCSLQSSDDKIFHH